MPKPVVPEEVSALASQLAEPRPMRRGLRQQSPKDQNRGSGLEVPHRTGRFAPLD